MEELDDDECRKLLGSHHVGRLAIVEFGGLMVFPANYVLDHDLVVFRTDPGIKLDAARKREQLAFEVDAADEATRTGWSVVVRGTLADLTDPADLARLRALPLYPWAPGERTRYLGVRPLKVTGRRIKVPDDLPFTWWGRPAASGHAGPAMTAGRPGRAGRARRYLLVAGFVVAYLAAGGVTLALGERVAGGGWLSLHLVLLGAATNAIVVWSEHFAAALLHAARRASGRPRAGCWRSISGSWGCSARSTAAVAPWPRPGRAWPVRSCWPTRSP